MPVTITTPREFKHYVFGGNAIVTIVSNKTQTHFTYKLIRTGKSKDLVVNALVGNKFRPFGKILCEKGFIYLHYASKTWIRHKAFLWVWRHIVNDVFPKAVFIWREDKCCVCGRRLTDPTSIKLGIGPECLKKHNRR